MGFTMKRTLALVLALMLAMPTFVLADGEAMAQDANGQITANELVLNDSPALDDGLLPDDDLLLDGDLVLDGLSPDLTQPEDPSGDLELGSQDPAEGGAAKQPGASETGATGEPPLELGDDAQDVEEEIPVAQPLMPPDYVLDMAQDGENVTDPALAANDAVNSPWQQLADDFQSKNTITLTTDCIASEGDTRLISATSGSFALNLDGNTINRNLNASQADGNVIYSQVDLTINGSGKITGGKNGGNGVSNSFGGGIMVNGGHTLTLASNAVITGNLAAPGDSYGCGGGVYLEKSGSSNPNKLIMRKSAITLNNANIGGGVCLSTCAQLEMNDDANIYDNQAGAGGGVYLFKNASFNMNGGSITGNVANGDAGYGGGVYLAKGSTFTMAKGQITGNTASSEGGGVYVGGNFSIGGGSNISITGNTKDGKANNVYLPANQTITVNGALTEDSIIGVTTAKEPSSSNGYIPITNSFLKNYLSNDSVFQSDNANYEVGLIENTDTNKQLGLGLKIVHKAESVSVDYDGNDHSPKVNVTVPEGSDQTVVTYKGELPEKVGKYTVEYEVSNSATVTSKYCFPAKGKGTVTIRPVVRIEGWTYGEQPKTPTVESASLPQGATLAYEYFTDADCTKKTTSADGASSEGGAPRNAGTYYVRATATVNSNEIKSLAKSFTIKSASMKGSAEGYKGEYDGRAHGITVSVTTPSTGYTVKYGTTKGTYDKSSLTYTEAGNYTVYYQVTAKNYVTVTGSETVEITAKASDNLSITLSQAEYTYDGAAKKPAVTVKDKDTSQVVPEKEYQVAYSDNVNAGKAKVTITDVEGGNYVVNGSKTFTIKSASMTVSAKSYKGEYDGKAHGITVSVTKPSTGYTVMFGSKAGTYDKSSLTYTNEGTYTVYYQVTAPNYVTVTGSATVEITAKGKATMTVSVSSYKRKYDGKAHGITVNVTNPKTGYTVKYGAKEGTYDKDSLTYTDTGVYTVYYQVTAENYKTVTGSATVEIIAKALDNDDLVIALSQAEYTYDGAAKKPAVTVKDKDTSQVVPEKEYQVAYSDNVNAGKAKVTITDVEGGNYVVNGDKTFTINKAAMKVVPDGYIGQYDGKAHGITVNVTNPKTGYTVNYGTKKGTYDKSSLTYTEAGNYTVYYQVTAKNYVTVTGSETVEITAKASDNLSITLSQAEYTYDGAAKKPAVTVKDKDTSQVVPEKEYQVAYSDNVNAGKAKVTITDVEGGNYVVNGDKTFTINKAAMKVVPDGYIGQYDGKAHGITVNVTNPKTGYTVNYGTKKGTYDKDSLTYTDVGLYTVYYQVIAENYKTVTGSATVEITAKALDNDDLAITLSQTEYTYDGTAKEPAVTVKDKDTSQVVPEKEYQVAYSDNVNAGKAKVTITDVEGGNYVVNGDKTFTINKAAMKVEANDYKGVYDGKAHGIAVSVTDPKKGRTVKYGEKEGTYNRDSLTYTDAGVYTVYYQVTAKNYETVTGSATVEITAKELDNDRDGDGIEDADSNAIITLEPAEYTYDGKAKKPLVTVTDKDTGLEVPLWEFRLYFSNNVNIGTAKVTISDADGGNYTVKGVKTFAIKGKPMTVAVNGYEGKYDGEAHGITVNVIEPSTGYTVKYGEKEGTYDKDSLTYTDVGVYTVYYQVTAEHYKTVTGSATVEITASEKASMTVVAEDYKGEYDGKAHGIKVTVTEPKTGYTVKYSTVDGTYDKESLTYTDTGVYTVYYQVTAKNYETVTGSATVEITARVPTDLTINLSAKTYYYYAKARKPTVTVLDGDTVVPESEYRVTYKNNIHAGTATVKITSFTKGNYRFEEERNFTIKPRNVHLKYTKLTFTYDGKYHLPLAKAIGVYPADENKYNVIMTGSGKNVGRYIARTTGIDNPDYHMLDVGEETRVIFYINPRGGRGSSSSGTGNARFVAEKKIGTEGIGTVTYDGKTQEPKFVVKCVFNDSNGVASNTVLTVPASEYKVTYSNNVDVGKATVKVTDVPGGNFIVDFSTEFTIAPRKATVTAKDQHVKTVDSVKTGVMAVKVKGLAKGHTLKSVKLDVDIKAGAKKGRIVPGRAKIVDAEGKDVTRNYKLDYAAGSLAVTAPKPDFTLLARMTVSGNSKKALKVAWTDVADACAYDVYFAKCGSEFRLKKTVKASKPRVVRFKGLDKRVSYKAYVKAWKMVNNQKVYIGNASPQVHAITGGYTSQECNTQSVKLNRTRLTLKAGGSASLKAKLKCVKSGKKLLDHADKVRWYSTDANVATVDTNGKVNAVDKGSCTIYAIANNGVRSSAKVKVK